MAVYLIRAGNTGFVKIGYARDVRQRIAGMQVDNHEPLQLLRTWTGGKDEERDIHGRFANYRVRGEWFVFVPEMMDGAPAIVREPRAPRVAHAHAEIIKSAGGISFIAKRLGLHRTTVFGWKKRGIPAIWWPRIIGIAAECGRDVQEEEIRRASRPHGHLKLVQDAA